MDLVIHCGNGVPQIPLGTVILTMSPQSFTFGTGTSPICLNCANGDFRVSAILNGSRCITSPNPAQSTATANANLTATATSIEPGSATPTPSFTPFGSHMGARTFNVLPDRTQVVPGEPINLTVTALRANNTVATEYRGTAVFTSTDPLAALPTPYTYTATDAGVHNFTAQLFTPGNQTLSVHDSVDPGVRGTSPPIAVLVPTPTSTPFPATCVEIVTAWGTQGSGNGQFNFPTGIGVDRAVNVYVVDSDNSRIEKFDANGNFLLTWGSSGSGPGQFCFPTGTSAGVNAIIGFSSTGNIYVADECNERIQVFDSNGNFLFQFGSGGTGNGQFANPSGIAIDSLDNVYVEDTFNNRVQKFTQTGGFLLAWGSSGAGPGQFNFGGAESGGLAADPQNHIFVSDTGNNRIQEFNSTGTFIRQWGTAGSGPGQFNSPQGLAVDGVGNLYAVDTGNDRVEVFNLTGTFVNQFGFASVGGPTEGTFTFPLGIAVDQNLNIYVTDTDNNRVEKFRLCNTPPTACCANFSLAWGTQGNGNGQFQYPWGISAVLGNHVYVADQQLNNIQRFSTNGVFELSWGGSGTAQGQFQRPRGVEVDAAGNVYVADTNNNRIQKFDANGGFITQWGTAGSGNGQFSQVQDVAIFNTTATTGFVYTVESGNNRVQKFDLNGSFLATFGSFGSGLGQMSGPNGISADASGNVYVADTNNDRVDKFNSSGVFLINWGGCCLANGQLFIPDGIANDAAGNVYVADTNNHRFEKFTSSGVWLCTVGSIGSANGQFNEPEAISLDPSGNIYVADALNRRVQKFNPCAPTPTPTVTSSPTPTITPTPTFTNTPAVLAVSAMAPLGAVSGSDPKPTFTSSPTSTPTFSPTPSPTPTPGNGLVQNVVAAPNLTNGQQPIHINFNLGHPATVKLSIFTLTGEQVFVTTATGNAGVNTLLWDARNGAQSAVASGLYLYVLQVDDGIKIERRTGKIALIH